MRIKRILVCISAVILLPCVVCLAKDIGFEATVTRTRVAVGQTIQLNLTFNNTQNIPALDIPQIEGFTSRYMGPSSSMAIVNGAVSSSVTHMYILQAIKTGKFTLGPYEFEHNGDTYRSNQVSLEVSAAAAQPQQAGPARQDKQVDLSQDLSERVFVVLEAAKKNMYVNEMVPLTVKLYVNRLSIRDIQFPEIQHDGISVGQFTQPKQYQDVVAGMMYDVIEFNTTVFGLKPGEVKIGPANVICNLIVKKQGRRQPSSLSGDDFFDSNVFDDFFGRYETHPLTLNSRSLPVTVQALPDEGKPQAFTGALGSYAFDVSVSPVEVRVGDPVTLKATIKGTGNFSTVSIPKIESTKDFKAYEPQIKQEEGQKTFEQVIIPLHSDNKSIPAIAFSFFNTVTGAYETITRGPFAITVAKPDKEEQAKIIEGNQVQAAQIPQEEKLGRDIIFIKGSDGGLSRKTG
ncbi:MAG: BatD family protein, partial [Candidatus Omnitrophota bacterium]